MKNKFDPYNFIKIIYFTKIFGFIDILLYISIYHETLDYI